MSQILPTPGGAARNAAALRTTTWGYVSPRAAAFDLRGPLRDIPTGYLMKVLRKMSANMTILRRCAVELSNRPSLKDNGAAQHFIKRMLTGRCDKCEKKALYIHSNKLACKDHRDWLTGVRQRTMNSVNVGLAERTEDVYREKQARDRKMAFHQASARRRR